MDWNNELGELRVRRKSRSRLWDSASELSHKRNQSILEFWKIFYRLLRKLPGYGGLHLPLLYHRSRWSSSLPQMVLELSFLLTLLPCIIVHNLSVKNCQWSFHQCWKYIFLQIFVLKRSLYKYCFKFVRLPSLLHFTFVFVMEVLYLSLSSRNFHICDDLRSFSAVISFSNEFKQMNSYCVSSFPFMYSWPWKLLI